jgi:putative tricarboxylic transport membrane protein
MNLRDQWSGLFWLIFSILVCVESIRMGAGSFHSPGPGFLPFWAGVAVGTLAVFLLAISTLKRKEGRKIWGLWRGMEWRKVILIAASLFIYGLFLNRLGYLISTFALMTLLFSVVERSKLWIQAAAALVTTLATYTTFNFWLGVQLPKGLFGF